MDTLERYFNNTTKISSSTLKRRLFRGGLKEKRCEKCLLTEWLSNPIPTELHHINGDSRDNALENLQILCPNCHSLTDNYRARKQDRKVIKKSVEEIIDAIKTSFNSRQALIKLGYAAKGANYTRIRTVRYEHDVNFRSPTAEELEEQEKARSRKGKRGKGGRTREEAWIASRKVIRPTKEELLQMVWDKPIVQIAKEFSICDNTIRKWAQIYKIPVPPVGYWAKFHNKHLEECSLIKEEMFSLYNGGAGETRTLTGIILSDLSLPLD